MAAKMLEWLGLADRIEDYQFRSGEHLVISEEEWAMIIEALRTADPARTVTKAMTPDGEESEADFIDRCALAKMDDGIGEDEAREQCQAIWDRHDAG